MGSSFKILKRQHYPDVYRGFARDKTQPEKKYRHHNVWMDGGSAACAPTWCVPHSLGKQ
jgi:hypothetical protein